MWNKIAGCIITLVTCSMDEEYQYHLKELILCYHGTLLYEARVILFYYCHLKWKDLRSYCR